MKIRHPREERTVVLVKPDGVKRGLIGEIISRIEQRNLKIVALSMIWATRAQIDRHYPKDKSWIRRLGEKTLGTYEKYNLDPVKELKTKDPYRIGLKVRGWLIDFLTSGPMVKMIVEGVHSVDMVRKICGNTLPNLADMGTIRGDFSVDSPAAANKDKRSVHNIVHASETSEEAENEMALWFLENEIHSFRVSEEETMF